MVKPSASFLVVVLTSLFTLNRGELPLYEQQILPGLKAGTTILNFNYVARRLLHLPSFGMHRLYSLEYGNRTQFFPPIVIGNASTFMHCNTVPPLDGFARYFCINQTTWQLETTDNYFRYSAAWETITLSMIVDSLQYAVKLAIRPPCNVQTFYTNAMAQCVPMILEFTTKNFVFETPSQLVNQTIKIHEIFYDGFSDFVANLQVFNTKNQSTHTYVKTITQQNPQVDITLPRDTSRLSVELISPKLTLYVDFSMTFKYYTLESFCSQWQCVENFYLWKDVANRNSVTGTSCQNTFQFASGFETCDADFTVSTSLQVSPRAADNATLVCSFNTLLPFEVTWFRLREDKKELLNVSGNSVSFDMINLNYDNYAYYKCIVKTPNDKYVKESPLLLVKLKDVFTGKLRLLLRHYQNVDLTDSENHDRVLNIIQLVKSDVESLFSTSSFQNITLSDISISNENGHIVAVGTISMQKKSASLESISYPDWILFVIETIKNENAIGFDDVVLHTDEFCQQTGLYGSNTNSCYELPTTSAGQFVKHACPGNTTMSINVKCGHVLPYYSSWEKVVDEDCTYWNATDIRDCNDTNSNDELLQLTKIKITLENVVSVTKSLEFMSKNMTSSEHCALAVKTLENIGDLITSSCDVVDSTMQTVDNILQVPKELLKNSEKQNETASRVLKFIEDAGESMASNNISGVNKTQFAVAGIRFDPMTFTGLHADIFNDGSNNQIKVQLATIDKSAETPQTDRKAELILPQSIKKKISSNSSVTVVFVTFKNDQLFPAADNETKVNTQIISAEVRGQTIEDLTEPISLRFVIANESYSNHNKKCVYWDPEAREWSDKGCYLNSTDVNAYVCSCNHLTNFAVLFNAIPPRDIHGEILTVITYVGLGISICGAFLTLLTYAIFPALHANIPPKILMNLCTALLLLNIVFVVAVERATSKIGCSIIAIVLQYFLLCVFTWSGIEGFHSARGLVYPMKTEISLFMPKVIFIGWGIPVILTAIGAGVWYDHYGNEFSCVVRNKPFFVTVLIPVASIMLFNFVSLVTITLSLRQSSTSKYSTNALKLKDRFRIIMTFMVLFGLTWAFGILVISNDIVVFQYIFCTFSGLQGLYIFILYCVRNKRARRYWSGVLHGESIREAQRSTIRQGPRKRADTVESIFQSFSESKTYPMTPEVTKKIGDF